MRHLLIQPYTLGLSEASITNCTAWSQDKLGFKSRAELVTFFAPNGFRRKLAERSINSERFLVGSSPLIRTKDIKNLSETEREIVGLLIAGSTNGDIAERRASSEHTVANQVQSIFRKLCAFPLRTGGTFTERWLSLLTTKNDLVIFSRRGEYVKLTI
jgi:DNA-binding CsgD family transcriptional regulator